jgi:hypothetical protein
VAPVDWVNTNADKVLDFWASPIPTGDSGFGDFNWDDDDDDDE